MAYEVTITNTGLIEVFDISVTAWGDGAGITGALTCNDVDEARQVASDDTGGASLELPHDSVQVQGLARYPDSGLLGGESLTCTFSSAVDQTEVSSTKNYRQQPVPETISDGIKSAHRRRNKIILLFVFLNCMSMEGRRWIPQT